MYTHDSVRRVIAAESDEPSRRIRETVCRMLGPSFGRVGVLLEVGGALIGGDRVAGRSPFGFGSDAAVGLGTVSKLAAKLCFGIVTLADVENGYAAAALLRQLVEVEYLAWAFAENNDEASRWLASTREERLELWQPRHLRARSNGHFRAAEYHVHCELGGHPTPDALRVLGRNGPMPAVVWLELALHGTRTWRHVETAANRLGWPVRLDRSEEPSLGSVIDAWREMDLLLAAIHVARDPGGPSVASID